MVRVDLTDVHAGRAAADEAEAATAFREATGGRTIHVLWFTRQKKGRGSTRLSSTADQPEGKTP
ncbi:hypothetical protein [Streptomyces bicolor]|uniref:hypothetical protein n=1 Tax=Streptomyces bicolor TaxID=66874 RepID=UPI0004E1FF7C|nr:hypothetical protein [Streptomyces bicolor]